MKRDIHAIHGHCAKNTPARGYDLKHKSTTTIAKDIVNTPARGYDLKLCYYGIVDSLSSNTPARGYDLKLSSRLS